MSTLVFVVSGAELNLEIMQVYVVSYILLFEFRSYALVLFFFLILRSEDGIYFVRCMNIPSEKQMSSVQC